VSKDRDGRLVRHAVVKMAIDDGASSSGRLFGTTVVETVDGVAKFADLRIDQPGQSYTLVARS